MSIKSLNIHKNTVVHPTSIIAPSAVLEEGVEVGPFCVIGENVTLRRNVKIHSHVSINCRTTIDEGSEVFPYVSFNVSQDLKYEGEDSEIIIGKNTRIREHATINNGSRTEQMKTVVGDNCLLMIGVHIAHDCIIGNNVIIANNSVLGGHVEVGDNVVIGGMAAIHQKVRIGNGAIIGGMSGVAQDVIPFGNARNDRAFLDGLNIVGLKRRNVEKKLIIELNTFFEEVFLKGNSTFEQRLKAFTQKYTDNKYVQEIAAFIMQDTRRDLCLPRKKVVV